ncbi:putative transmembrane protein [Bacteroides coprosuis DSM 18011]|uniref:Putative transmembrane protein n=1 Tax=Bacteroides coprosuis DSM 18011 TaxID=679937 RepID=F3ZTZ8_9BACE|nr:MULTISPECIES: lysylphosphatidylglycerol synthase transmembrane domain-containing protein [Bacteroides]EGJ71099.1 putative transmembrane protein [Bacteroides coprosuis DSM 18011]
MNKHIRHLFFLMGLAAIIFMMVGFDLTLSSLFALIKQAGFYFPIVLLLWILIYAINTCSWRQILSSLAGNKVPWNKLYKFTVSGFALNYVTPGGLNGGEPYRILELKEYVGVARATSSTMLYVIVHIGSHLLFWALGAFLFLFYPTPRGYLIVAVVVLITTLIILFLFHKMMHKGMAQLFAFLLIKIPWIGKYIKKFEESHHDVIEKIDNEVRTVYVNHSQNFYKALGLELTARVLGCVEIWLLIVPLMGYSNFILSYFIMAISSLMANILFFMPMQLGGREGGFTLAFTVLGLSPQYGLFVGLLVRIRELVWIAIGILLIQVGRSKNKKG